MALHFLYEDKPIGLLNPKRFRAYIPVNKFDLQYERRCCFGINKHEPKAVKVLIIRINVNIHVLKKLVKILTILPSK